MYILFFFILFAKFLIFLNERYIFKFKIHLYNNKRMFSTLITTVLMELKYAVNKQGNYNLKCSYLEAYLLLF